MKFFFSFPGRADKILKILIFSLLFFCPGGAAVENNDCQEDNSRICRPAKDLSPFLNVKIQTEPVRGFSDNFAFTSFTGERNEKPKSSGHEKAKVLDSSPPLLPRNGGEKIRLELFYTYNCPHCRSALKWLESFSKEYPEVETKKYEVEKNMENFAILKKKLSKAKTPLLGFPTFFAGDSIIVGFSENSSPEEIMTALNLIDSCRQEKSEIAVPFFGNLDPKSLSLSQFAFVLGLLDGLNPCAMWVLAFLMGLLVYTRSPKRMLFVGGIFLASSALVYFAFMAAWFNLFTVLGNSRWITVLLAVAAIAMGLINIKEIFFFRRGISLTIADNRKMELAKKIRGIINKNETAAMAGGTFLLAIFVNFIELGCTTGFPAIFTRIVSARDTGIVEKYWYMAIYNLAYIIPLAVIVLLFLCTMGRRRMTERHGKMLKGISGFFLLALGLLMLFKPEVLFIK